MITAMVFDPTTEVETSYEVSGDVYCDGDEYVATIDPEFVVDNGGHGEVVKLPKHLEQEAKKELIKIYERKMDQRGLKYDRP